VTSTGSGAGEDASGTEEVLAGRGALVIGAASGIGRGIALALATEGLNVVVADIDLRGAESTAAEIRHNGGLGQATLVDATELSSLSDLHAEVRSDLPDLAVLSWNVGVTLDRSILGADAQDWSWILQVNLLSAVKTVQTFAPAMLERGTRSHILLTASLAALVAPKPAQVRGRRLGLYIASKHALLGYAESLRNELEGTCVTVSVVCPGAVRSNLDVNSRRLHPSGAPSPTAPGPGPHDLDAMPTEIAARLIVRAMKADRFNIVTHPETEATVLARHQRLVSDYDFLRSGL
jgi:NAD(P)-dependent dehydrogenase (short-subunit alcohol dehydrogenase family)